MKRILIRLATMLFIITVFTSIFSFNNVKAAEEVMYCSVETFSSLVAKEINVSAVSDSYAEGLKAVGIIKEDDFTDFNMNISRGDALVILNRADDFLNRNILFPELIQLAIDKRISDIDKVAKDKRVGVAMAYLKGFMKGYSNGAYSTNRELRVSKKITKAGALSCIAMLKDKSKRAKISPDGQLIRTTKLPKSYKNYPYILASFPNAYYDWKFFYEITSETTYNEKTGKREKVVFKDLVDYAKPADLDLTKDIENFPSVKKERMESWVNKAKTHMECIFNIDYRTSGKEWIDKIISASNSSGIKISEDNEREMLTKFLEKAKNNKTVIESGLIATDGSSMYYFKGSYYLRFYVKYRIVSSKTLYKSGEAYLENDLFYTNFPIMLNDFELGEWKECFFDVELDNHHANGPEYLGVYQGKIVEEFYTGAIIK